MRLVFLVLVALERIGDVIALQPQRTTPAQPRRDSARWRPRALQSDADDAATTVLLPSVKNRTGTGPTVLVGGEAVALDAFGPIVIQRDGSLKSFPDWDVMTPFEQEKALAFVAARNKKRRAALLAAQRSDIVDE
jgi:hypothetical protein